jgi:hypothetical protein
VEVLEPVRYEGGQSHHFVVVSGGMVRQFAIGYLAWLWHKSEPGLGARANKGQVPTNSRNSSRAKWFTHHMVEDANRKANSILVV